MIFSKKQKAVFSSIYSKQWRRKMFKKLLIVVSILLVAAMVLPACTTPTTPATEVATTAPGTTEVATTAPSGPPKWLDWHAMDETNDPIAEMVMGTGPYTLVSWDHSTRTVTLKANPTYWRTEPIWDGSKTGVAAITNVVIKGVDEWGTRFSMATAGDADFFNVPRANISQVDPLVAERIDYDPTTGVAGPVQVVDATQPLRLDYGMVVLSRTDIVMNENVQQLGGGSPFTGSGSIAGGRGIPNTFFSDVHIRKAFNYCMDWQTYIKDYLLKEGTQTPYNLTLPGELGYDPNGGKYEFDLAKCEAEFKAAAPDAKGNQVWDTGFYMVGTYNSGNVGRQTILNILSNTLKALNPKFQVIVLAMPWAAELQYYQSGQLPLFCIGWQEDIHDPHNWYSPYLLGTYAQGAGFPDDQKAIFSDLVNKGVAATTDADRAAVYAQLNQIVYDYAPYILGPSAIARHYEQKWMQGWYNNPLYGDFYYYELAKAADAKNPDTITVATIGEPQLLDPAIDYETAGSEITQNVYETLVWYDKTDATKVVPVLATALPDVSADGMTYTFNIRPGVTFSNGDPLTPTDVAYSFQRALLLGSSYNSPVLLLTEPILGIGILDIAYMIDPTGALSGDVEGMKAQDPAKLNEICQTVMNSVVADEAAGTVTFHLKQPYGPFLVTLAHTVAAVMDKNWVISNSGWDGTCN